MVDILSLLKSVPAVFWAAMLASIFTLSGVLLSNRNNTGRLRIQLDHDAAEKAKERIATLRRETYLKVAEELVKINSYLPTLPQADIAKLNANEGMQGFFVAAARLQLIAEPATALLVSKLAARYSELSLMVIGRLIPISNAKTDISIADDFYSRAQAQVSRLLAEMAKQNESGRPNPDVYHVLAASFDFQQDQSNKFSEARSEAWGRYNILNCEFQRFLLQEIRDIGGGQISVMVEIRKDLGLSGDFSEIEGFMREQWGKMEDRLDGLIGTLQEELN